MKVKMREPPKKLGNAVIELTPEEVAKLMSYLFTDPESATRDWSNNTAANLYLSLRKIGYSAVYSD
jgi:hypothetical protein